MMEILVPVITMGVLGLLFSLGLVFAYKRLQVYIDPKIEKIAGILPQANCGACGFAGCHDFAEAAATGRALPSACFAGGEEVSKQIAEILGVKAGAAVKSIARLHCRGSFEAAKDRAFYLGISTCSAAHLLGGNKMCSYGCLHFGDCAPACPFDAIQMAKDGLPLVKQEKCTGCGKCVKACPRNLFELHPIIQKVIVFCRSEDRGAVARKYCKNACIACGICIRACPEAIVLEKKLAKIVDYKKIDPEKIPEIEKCPTAAIGRLNKTR